MKLEKIAIFSILILCMSSCVSNKRMIYLQGADYKYVQPQDIDKAFELYVQPDDQLAISVSSKNKELISPFDNNTLIGSGSGGSTSGYSSSSANTTSGVSYFKVDEKGYIQFPIFGPIQVGGKSTNAISEYIQSRLISEGYINDAIVNTKIMSFKVTVLGDVKNPGPQTYQGERLTILEAIGKAGDLTNSALRENILVVREENGKRTTYKVNLCDEASVFESPVYYLQQNDIVYVQPNKSQRVKGSTSYTWLSVGSTVVGMLVSIVSLVVALKK